MTVEQCYNNMRWTSKNDIKFPNNYYELSVEQRMFIDDFYESFHKPLSLQDDLEYLTDLTKELDEATSAFRRRYSRD